MGARGPPPASALWSFPPRPLSLQHLGNGVSTRAPHPPSTLSLNAASPGLAWAAQEEGGAGAGMSGVGVLCVALRVLVQLVGIHPLLGLWGSGIPPHCPFSWSCSLGPSHIPVSPISPRELPQFVWAEPQKARAPGERAGEAGVGQVWSLKAPWPWKLLGLSPSHHLAASEHGREVSCPQGIPGLSPPARGGPSLRGIRATAQADPQRPPAPHPAKPHVTRGLSLTAVPDPSR